MVMSMKILWLCNMMLPVVGVHLGLETSPKEGWLSGLLSQVLADDQNRIEQLALAFPVSRELLAGEGLAKGETLILQGTLECLGKQVEYYGFCEDTSRPEEYEEALEGTMKVLLDSCAPDIVHIFGTEYPHALAMTRACNRPERTLIGVQGLCSLCADAYFASLPEDVIESKTFRDILKRDSILQQQEKFRKRGENEREAIKNVGHITGRTHWDAYWTEKWNPKATYHKMNETLRGDFYTERWDGQQARPGAIFVSQGDYPLKGLHYMLLAMPQILGKYPEAKVYVAGNSLIKNHTLKDKLKTSGYGRYLKKLIKQLDLQDKVVFLGRLSAQQMKEQYLHSSAYVCCSSVENSPNSLGEAMLLGMPCVAADVGGISSLLQDGVDGILYRGFSAEHPLTAEQIAGNLAKAILRLWGDSAALGGYCENARNHAKITHDGRANFEKLMEIYRAMLETPRQ